MRRLLRGVATGSLALVLCASTALAFQCPALIKQVNDAAGNRLDSAGYTAREMVKEAEALHKAGKHADAVMKAEDAAKAIGLKLQMRR